MSHLLATDLQYFPHFILKEEVTDKMLLFHPGVWAPAQPPSFASFALPPAFNCREEGGLIVSPMHALQDGCAVCLCRSSSPQLSEWERTCVIHDSQHPLDRCLDFFGVLCCACCVCVYVPVQVHVVNPF